MPYKSNTDLPDKVKEHLPAHAQDIYREAFNHALKEYKNPDNRKSKYDSAEEVAHKVAWAAVKLKFKKDEKSGNWKLK